MTPEQLLREKLRKIEALFAGAATEGERVAAGAAVERIRDRLGHAAAATIAARSTQALRSAGGTPDTKM